MSAIRKQVIESIHQILERQKVEDYLVNPRIPEVLSNPDFLVVPSLGSMVTIAVEEIQSDKNWWSITLALLEDLFEIKLSTGSLTCCVLIIISEANEFSERNTNKDALKLLQSFYDQVIIINGKIEQNAFDLRQILLPLLENPPIKQKLFQFWLDEMNSRQANYARISDLPYVKIMLESLRNESKDKGIHFKQLKNNKGLLKQLSSEIPQITDFDVKQNVKVRNIKEQFVGRPYYFTFDLMLLQHQRHFFQNDILTRSDLSRVFRENGAFINVLLGEQDVFRKKEKLRKLAIYSRFISYDIEQGELHVRSDPPNLFLLLVNDLWGPDFAPERYLQMLISAGWKPIRPSDLTRENLLKR